MSKKQTTPTPAWKQLNAFRIVRRKLLDYLGRVTAIQNRGGTIISDEMMARLLGVEEALNEATQQKSHLDHWLNESELLIIQAHKGLRENCRCGVCAGKAKDGAPR